MRAYSTASGGVIFVPDTMSKKRVADPAQKPVLYTSLAAEDNIKNLDARPLTAPAARAVIKRLVKSVGLG